MALRRAKDASILTKAPFVEEVEFVDGPVDQKFTSAAGGVLRRLYAGGTQYLEEALAQLIGFVIYTITRPMPTRQVTDANISLGSRTLTSATAAFVAGDVGSLIQGGAWALGSSRIVKRNSATSVDVADVATTALTGSTIQIGVNRILFQIFDQGSTAVLTSVTGTMQAKREGTVTTGDAYQVVDEFGTVVGRISKGGNYVPNVNVVTGAPGAAPAIDWFNYGKIDFRAVNANITSMTTGLVAGTPYDGQKLLLGFKDSTAAVHTLAWGASFASTTNGVLPTATLGNTTTTLWVALMYNAGSSKWECMGVA